MGSGSGSGSGAGAGSGSGAGVGSGVGSGLGSGTGVGSGVGSVVGSGVGSGCGSGSGVGAGSSMGAIATLTTRVSLAFLVLHVRVKDDDCNSGGVSKMPCEGCLPSQSPLAIHEFAPLDAQLSVTLEP